MGGDSIFQGRQLRMLSLLAGGSGMVNFTSIVLGYLDDAADSIIYRKMTIGAFRGTRFTVMTDNIFVLGLPVPRAQDTDRDVRSRIATSLTSKYFYNKNNCWLPRNTNGNTEIPCKTNSRPCYIGYEEGTRDWRRGYTRVLHSATSAQG